MSTSASQIPADGTTLTDVLEAFAHAGFVGSFSVTDDSRLQCHECEAVSSPRRVEMASLRQLEATSEHDDVFVAVAVTCPSCASRGTLILGFGPTAPPEDGDVLNDLQDARTSHDVSAD